MSIFLIRHGETALNASRVLQPPGTPLSERGIAQAQALAPRIAALGASAIVSSDLPRTSMTAVPIAIATGLPVSFTPLLQERNFGDLRGLPYDTLGFDPIAAEEGAPNGESMTQFRDRVRQAFDHILALRAQQPGNLVVVSHGLVIRVMIENWLALGGEVAPEKIANTSLTIFDADAPHQARLVNCDVHLTPELRGDGKGLAGV